MTAELLLLLGACFRWDTKQEHRPPVRWASPQSNCRSEYGNRPEQQPLQQWHWPWIRTRQQHPDQQQFQWNYADCEALKPEQRLAAGLHGDRWNQVVSLRR